MTRPNNVASNYGYDNQSRLLSVLHQLSGSTIDGAVYTVDSAGNRTAKTDKHANVTSNYGYDAIYELLQTTQGGTTTESYTYDPVGNRLSSLGVSPYSNNSSNELTSTPSASYTYDNNGNTLTKTASSSTTNYTWDYENRLTSVVLPGTGGTVTFKYDPLGRRAQKAFTQASTTTTTNYVFDGDNSLQEMDQNGNLLARYTETRNIDEPLAESRSGATSYYESDGLGSVTSLSNATGALASTYAYDSFGQLTASTGTLTNPFRFTGREFDSETGFYFYRARYYDEVSGRFMSEDPLGLGAGINYYRYVRNNGVNLSDPTGLYQLEGFPPADAAQMTIAIGELWAKLKATPCCINPQLRDKVLKLLQPGSSDSGVTFVYKEKLPQGRCARVGNGGYSTLSAFLTNTVQISGAQVNGTHGCWCPLAGTILHEIVHLTGGNFWSSQQDREAGAYGAGSSCFGPLCADPSKKP